jgi:hypothetical protein
MFPFILSSQLYVVQYKVSLKGRLGFLKDARGILNSCKEKIIVIKPKTLKR